MRMVEPVALVAATVFGAVQYHQYQLMRLRDMMVQRMVDSLSESELRHTQRPEKRALQDMKNE